MNFKVFAAFFVTLLAVHASSQNPIQDDSIKELVISIVSTVLNETSYLLGVANGLVDDLETNQEAIKDSIVQMAIDDLKELNTKIITFIDGLKDGATDVGKAVIDCLEAEQGATDAAVAKHAVLIGNCLVGEVNVILPELRSILGQLNDLQVDVEGQLATLTACTSEELTCLIAFGTTLIETANKIPPAVEAHLAAIKALIDTIIADVKTCDLLPGIHASIQEIFNEGVVCIKG